MFRWKKKGLIFSPRAHHPWMHHYAQCPFSLDFGNFIRIYFATREPYNAAQVRAFGGFVDVDPHDLSHILRVCEEPLLPLGGPGEFDEFGSMPTSVVCHNGQYYLYYVGWTRCHTVPYDWEIGLATSQDGAHFVKMGKGPLIGPTLNEPYLNSTPVVYKWGETNWHLFYHTGVQWLKTQDKWEAQYVLKHATSSDGLHWQRNARPILPPKVPYECQTTPAVFYADGKYHMFFCYRQGLDFRHNREKSYRIGYAWSADLQTWHRDDAQVGIDVSQTGWDSQMIEYPHIAYIGGKWVMFYCGNHFGQDGFGYAELEEI